MRAELPSAASVRHSGRVRWYLCFVVGGEAQADELRGAVQPIGKELFEFEIVHVLIIDGYKIDGYICNHIFDVV